MRIVIDLQGAQTGSQFRGIGRNALSLSKALIRRGPEHEFIILLNGLLSDTIEYVRAAFEGILPQGNIRVWDTPGPIERFDSGEANLREIAEIMREHYVRALEPDVLVINSLFEGMTDNAVVSVKKHVPEVPVACIFHDFTPLILPDEQFRTNPLYRIWYRERIANLLRSDLLLAVSESSRNEAITEVNFPADRAINISSGCDEQFHDRGYNDDQRAAVRERLGITKPYILYAGGLERNKNLKNLIAALPLLPAAVRRSVQFVCAGKREPGEIEQILGLADDPDVRGMIRVLGYVSEDDLVDLYNCCELFVFPSLREGFGLPALEAMACGAPTIVSDRTSLPEVVENPVALFDPESPPSIAGKMAKVLTDSEFRDELRQCGLKRASALTWDRSADTALAALKRLARPEPLDTSRKTRISGSAIFKPNRISILVQKLDHHGDFFLGLPAMAKLRARYPHARIEALVGSWNRDAAIASGLFDQVHVLDFFKSKSSVPARIEREALEALGQLGFYDYAIDLRRHSDTRFILFHVNATLYFGYKTGDGDIDRLLSYSLATHPEHAGERGYFDSTHASEQLLRLIDILPFDVNDYLHLPEVGQRSVPRAGAVAIFPRVGVDSRQWHSDRIGQLVAQLVASDDVSEVNIYAGKLADLDIIPLPAHEKLRIQCGLAFSELVTSLSGNLVCIGNNSFGVHLASYVGCRTIGIYSGHELPDQWGPAFNGAQTVTIDAACAPCHLPDRESCRFDLFCLTDISVPTVMKLALQQLRGEPAVPERANIRSINPASAIKPLVDAINRASYKQKITTLNPGQRLALGAAIAANFPERSSGARRVLIDLTPFIPWNPGAQNMSALRLLAVRSLATKLRPALGEGFEFLEIASGQHDHEFYAVEQGALERFDHGDRAGRIVLPMPGDIFLSIERYYYNQAQWELLQSWRRHGVTTVFFVPSDCTDVLTDSEADEGKREAVLRYLKRVAQFDLLFADSPMVAERLQDWAKRHALPRQRSLAIASSALPAMVTSELCAAHTSRPESRDAARELANAIAYGPTLGSTSAEDRGPMRSHERLAAEHDKSVGPRKQPILRAI